MPVRPNQHAFYIIDGSEHFFEAKDVPYHYVEQSDKILVLDLMDLTIEKCTVGDMYQLASSTEAENIEFVNSINVDFGSPYDLGDLTISRENLNDYDGHAHLVVNDHVVDFTMRYGEMRLDGAKVDLSTVGRLLVIRDYKKTYHLLGIDCKSMLRKLCYIYREGDNLVQNYLVVCMSEGTPDQFAISVVHSLNTGEFLGYYAYKLDKIRYKVLEKSKMVLPLLSKNILRGY